jgi:ribosomal protein S18 acetylase RimI-like enzyme
VLDCANIFINKKLSEDYFFNRLSIKDCNNTKSTLEECIKIQHIRNKTNCYIYIADSKENDNKLEKLLIKKGFSQIDVLQISVLRSDNAYNNKKYYGRDARDIRVVTINKGSIGLWSELFSTSFDVPEWRYEVEKIMNVNFDRLLLLVSYFENKPAGCCALLSKDSITGLYCLGTLSCFRHRGLARKMILKCIEVAKQQGSEFLLIQTFWSEKLTRFYRKNRFKTLYNKKVYALYHQ